MERADIHVVLGASGGIGGAIVRALVERGHLVRAVNRAGDAEVPAGVERAAANVASIEGARRAVEGATVVYHAAQPRYTRWVEEFPSMNRAVVDATAEVGAKLVFADNLYAYGPVDAPMTEETPIRATGKKGTLRARMAEELLETHRQGRLRVTIGRASDYFGPGGRDSAIGDRLFRAALKGRKVPWLGSLDVPHTVSYTEDIGRAYAVLGERPDADGRVWHLPAEPAVTGRAFVAMVSEGRGRPLVPATTTPAMVRMAGWLVPMIRELNETMYQWTEPWEVDAGGFDRAFGPFPTTPLPQAVATTLAWYRGRSATGHAGRGA
jgi:nucleoside-diphosphate-sugar epimerase